MIVAVDPIVIARFTRGSVVVPVPVIHEMRIRVDVAFPGVAVLDAGVGYRGAGVRILDMCAVLSGVPPGDGVRHRRTAKPVVHHPGMLGRVSGERAVRRHRTAEFVVHSTAIDRRVSAERAVRCRQIAVVVQQSAAETGRVSGDGAVSQGRAAARGIHRATRVVRVVAVGISAGKRKAIEDRGFVEAQLLGMIEDVIAVLLVVRETRAVVIVKIRAQNGLESPDVAVVGIPGIPGIDPPVAARHDHPVNELEGGSSMAATRAVGPLGHANFREQTAAGGHRLQGVLQIGIPVHPTRPVVEPVAGGAVDVDDRPLALVRDEVVVAVLTGAAADVANVPDPVAVAVFVRLALIGNAAVVAVGAGSLGDVARIADRIDIAVAIIRRFVGPQINPALLDTVLPLEVRVYVSGNGGIVADVDTGGVRLQVIVALHPEIIVWLFRRAVVVPVPIIEETRVGVEIALTGVAAFDATVGHREAGGGIVDLHALLTVVSPEDAIRHDRTAVVVSHRGPLRAGRVPGEGAIRHGRAAAVVRVHPAAESCRVPTEGAVCQGRAAGAGRIDSAANGGRVSGERAARHGRGAIQVVYRPAPMVGHVSGKGAVRYHRSAGVPYVNGSSVPGPVSGERAVGHRRVAVAVEHRAAVAGGVFGKRAVRHSRAAVDVVHSPTVPLDRVSGERALPHYRVTAVVKHSAAAVGRIGAERAIRYCGVAAVAVEHPAAVPGPVLRERTVLDGGAATSVVHSAAVVPRRVSGEDAVRHRGAGMVIGHPAAVLSRVSGEDAVRHRRSAVAIVHPAAATAVGVSAGDGEAVEDRGFVHVQPRAII